MKNKINLIRLDTILQFLYTYSMEHKYPPNIREIGEGSGVPSTSVTNYYLNKLEKQGLVIRARKISRGTFLTDLGMAQARILLGYAPPHSSPNHCSQCGAPVNAHGAYRRESVKVHTKRPAMHPVAG